MGRRVSIGIDLGGTHLRAALISTAGAASHHQCLATPLFTTAEDLLAALVQLVEQLQQHAREAALDLQAVGIGIPASLDCSGRIVQAPNLSYLNGLHLGQRLGDRVTLPVAVCNDADAAAYGEYRFGAGAGFESFAMITLGTGVGGALMLSNALWRGSDGMAGEIGHLTVDPQGRECRCGNHGCLEQYASASGIVRTACELLAGDADSQLQELSAEELTSAAIAAAANDGDSIACAAFAEAGRRLGQVLAGVAVNLLNLDGAVIGGGVAPSLALMLPALERELERRAFAYQAKRFTIRPSQLGDDAGLIGAALFNGGTDGEGSDRSDSNRRR